MVPVLDRSINPRKPSTLKRFFFSNDTVIELRLAVGVRPVKLAQ